MDSLFLSLTVLLLTAVSSLGSQVSPNQFTVFALVVTILVGSYFLTPQLPGLMCSVSSSDLLSSLALSLFSSWVMHILLFYSFILVAVSSLFSLLIST